MDTTIEQAIAAFAEDNVSGAAAISERAADILVRRASMGEAASPDAFRQEIFTTGWALIHAQPAVAPIVNLVDAVLWRLEREETPARLRQAVIEVTDQFKRQMKHHKLQVAEEALGLIGEDITIVTMAYSSTVQHALVHAQRVGRHFSVICAESRPACEGRDTADKLASYGIPVTLMIDMAALEAVADAQLVLVGADMLTSTGVMSKIGTRMLALAAQHSGVPIYSLCSSKKFLPSGFKPLTQKEHAPEGVWPDAPARVHVSNRFTDMTPLQDFTGIVTEQGIMPAATIEAWFAATTIHPALATPSAAEVRTN
jgi:translation initiation factor eIF-2B subunit delta